MRSEDYAAMDLDALNEAKRDLLGRRRAATERSEEMNSEVGRRILQRKQDELDKHRKKYLAIPVLETPAEEVRLLLLKAQDYEKYILADMAAMTEPEKFIKMLDNELRLCNDAIRIRDVSARTER